MNQVVIRASRIPYPVQEAVAWERMVLGIHQSLRLGNMLTTNQVQPEGTLEIQYWARDVRQFTVDVCA